MSVIVSRFAIVTEDLVICCYQVTKIFSTRYGSAIASSARSPCNFGPRPDLAISVFREVSPDTVCLPKSSRLVRVGNKDNSWEEVACESLRSRTLSSTRFSPNSYSHSGMSEQNLSPGSFSWFSFLCGLGFLVGLGNNGSLRSTRSTSELDTSTGWESIPFRSSRARISLSLDTFVIGEVDELEEDVGWLRSCLDGVIDVEEWELEEELADKLWTTIGTKFSVLHCIWIPFFTRCGFLPLNQLYEYTFSSKSFPSDKTAGVSSWTFTIKNISNSLTYTVASSCVCTSPLAVVTIVRLRDSVKVSISAEFKLIMCIDTPESKTISRSSGLRLEAGMRLFNFRTLLASLHTASRAPCSCHSVSSWDRSSNFGAMGLRSWSSPGQINHSERRIWSRMSACSATTFVNFTDRIGFRMSELFRKIVVDFGGSRSWNTQPNFRVLFSTATALLSPFLLDLLLDCSSTCRCAKKHFSTDLQPLSDL